MTADKKGIPKSIIDEIKLSEPKPLTKTATLIQDTKYTKQFSLKIPISIIEEVGWKAGSRIAVQVDGNCLKLKQTREA